MNNKIIMSLDYSFANSGVCISKIIDDKIVILYSDVYLSDKDKEAIPRVTGLVEDIFDLYDKYSPDIIVKEAGFIGRSSTAKNVMYAHAILELVAYNKGIEIEEIHNATLKAYCKKYLIDKAFYTKEELKQFDKKQIVAEFLKAYFSSDMSEIYTKRGKLLDDKADAICLSVFYFEKNLK